MRPAVFKFGLFALLVAGGSIVIARQWRAANALRDEVSRLQEQNRDSGRVQTEHERLASGQLAADERERLRIEQAEMARLRDELSALQRASQPAVPPAGEPTSAAAATVEPTAKQWTNAGHATPSATFESVLWSAAQGDTDALAAMIAFDPAGRALADALFARLPEEMRAKSGTPEKVFATLLAARLPQDLSTATVITETPQTANAVVLQMHLQHTDGREKNAGFYFTRGSDGWQLVVPPSVVENYQAMLANPPPPGGVK